MTLLKYSTLKYFAGATKEQIAAAAKKLNITPEELLNLVHNVDPTNEKKFEAWLIKQMSFKNIRLPEDGNRVTQVLNDFISLSNKKQLKQRDIQQYRRIHDLEAEIDAIKGAEVTEDTSDKLKEYLALPGVDIFGQNNEWLILTVSEPESASKLALGTKWCTSDPTTAEDYIEDKYLLVIFKKTGSNLEKMYQATWDLTQFMDLKDDSAENLPNSLGHLFMENINMELFVDIDDLYQNYLKFVKNIFPDLQIPEEYVQEYKDYILTETEALNIDWGSLIQDDLSFRDIILEHPDTVENLDILWKCVNQYLGYYTYSQAKIKPLPRWEAFEEMVENLPPLEITEIEENEHYLKIILEYLAKTEKFGRWEAVDEMFLYMEKKQTWYYDMFLYLQNNFANKSRWIEFETELRIEIYNLRLAPREMYNELCLALSLAVEYWVSVSPEGSRWEEIEPPLLSDGRIQNTTTRLLTGGKSPVERYQQHTGLREIEMRRR